LEESIVSAEQYTQPTPLSEVDMSGMVEIPAGEFQMGVSETAPVHPGYIERFPSHTVYLDTFYIDRYETTNAEYVEFLNVLGETYFACNGVTCVDLQPPSYTDPSRILEVSGVFVVEEGYEDYPVVSVTWEGANAYCRWRGKRLPTEAEWEKAARGTEGLLYPWGDEWDPDKYARRLSPVGSYPTDVSPYGVWDVGGNAREWVSDWYDSNYYAHSPYRNPTGPNGPVEPGMRITRPANGELFFRAPTRHDFAAGTGFRCAYAP